MTPPDGDTALAPRLHVSLIGMSGGRKGWRLKAVVSPPGQKPMERWHRLTAAEAHSASTREHAREGFARQLLAEFSNITPPTFADLARQFFASSAARVLADGSRATLRRHIERDVLPHIGALDPSAITHHDCQRVIDAAAKLGYLPNSLRRIRFAMSKLFSFAQNEGVLKLNPVKKMPPQPKADGITDRTLTDAQYRAVLAAAKDTHWRAVIEVLHATWIRRGELCGLQWGDVDFVNRTLMVRRSVWQTGRDHGVKAPKTQRGTRPIVLPQRTVDLLARLKAKQAHWIRDVAARDQLPTDYVFQRTTGGYLFPTTVSHAISDFMRAAGVPAGLGAHALRHTGASLAMAQGHDAKAVANRLGHASVATTLDLYVHPSTQVQVGLADLMERKAEEFAAD